MALLRCPHQKHGVGCAIYAHRPKSCELWSCRWLVDDQTSSKWTPYGECVAGKLKGTQLLPILPQPSFWFAWAEFYPDTEVFTVSP